jgi:hypothetical protein
VPRDPPRCDRPLPVRNLDRGFRCAIPPVWTFHGRTAAHTAVDGGRQTGGLLCRCPPDRDRREDRTQPPASFCRLASGLVVLPVRGDPSRASLQRDCLSRDCSHPRLGAPRTSRDGLGTGGNDPSADLRRARPKSQRGRTLRTFPGCLFPWLSSASALPVCPLHCYADPFLDSRPLFWVYFTGIGFIAAAIATLVKIGDRLASLMLGVMFLLWVLVLHAPRVAASPHNGDEWSSLFVALALGGGAWMLAHASSPIQA